MYTPKAIKSPFLSIEKNIPRALLIAALAAQPIFGLFGSEALAGCVWTKSTQSCLKDECRAGFCVHAGTYRSTTTGYSTELTVHTRPARGTHINFRCMGGEQREGGVHMRCGGTAIFVQSCIRGKMFKASRCDPWQSFSGK